MPPVAPPLRESLKIGKLVQQGELSYVVKEPDKQAYYHFSEAQYEAICLFDGVRDLQQVTDIFNQKSALYEFDLEGIGQLFDTCREFALLKRSKQEQNAALLEKIKEDRKKKRLQGEGSLLFLRFQLVDPNDFFNKIINRIRFLWHPLAIKLQFCFLVIAALIVLFQGDRFLLDFNRVYLQNQQGAYGLFGIWLIALGAIAVHECGHGLTCKYFGGDVHEMGFLLLAFQPCLYCNVNDAWLFESKWQKIYVALAGVWVELLLAGASAFIWLFVDVGNIIGYIAYVLLTIGTTTSLLINLNPLLKFDGYYILTDLLEMPNLRQNSIAWFSWTLKSKILLMDEEAPFSPSPSQRRVYLIYGALVTLYMIAILSFLAIIGYGFVSQHFGFIANIAFIYLTFYLVKKITNSWGETLLTWAKRVFLQSKKRQNITLIGVIMCLLIVIFWKPAIQLNSDGQVQGKNQIIYAPQNAFIDYVGYNAKRALVNSPGQDFIRLTSPDLSLAKNQLLNEHHMLSMQLQEAANNFDRGLGRRLIIEQSLLDEKIQVLDKQNQSLTIVQPEGDWMVEGLPPQSQQGRYYAKGDEIVTLISTRVRFMDVIVDQRDVHFVSVGDKGKIRFSGVAPHIYQAIVTQISPVAKLEGIEQSLLVRMEILLNDKDGASIKTIPMGLSGEVVIFGQSMALWRHGLHAIRKVLRADLWL